MPKEKGECQFSDNRTGAESSVRRPMEISPEAYQLLRNATIPSEFKDVVREVVPPMGVASAAEMEGTPTFPGIDMPSIERPTPQVSIPPVEMPVASVRMPWPEMSISDRDIKAFYLTDLTLDLSGVAHMTPGLLQMTDCSIGQFMLCSDGEDNENEGAPRDEPVPTGPGEFPGPIPENPEWARAGKPIYIGATEVYDEEYGKTCRDELYEFTKYGPEVTKDLLVKPALFYRLEEYIGPSVGPLSGQVQGKICVYLADVIHRLRYRLYQKFIRIEQVCSPGGRRVLSEYPAGEPLWQRLHYLEFIGDEKLQICFSGLTSQGDAKGWIKNYIKEYGPDILDLGAR